MRVKVTFEVDVQSQKASEEDVQEWIEFELGAIGGMDGANPLCMTDIDGENVIVDEI